MSVLTVLAVPAGILFGADRNVSVRIRHDAGQGLRVERVGVVQRPKVLKWPNREAIIGYFGLAQIARQPTDLWLYDFIGRNLNYRDLGEVANALAADLQAEIPPDDMRLEALVLHLAGFDDIDGEPAPVIWFIHNTWLKRVGPLRPCRSIQSAHRGAASGYTNALPRQERRRNTRRTGGSSKGLAAVLVPTGIRPRCLNTLDEVARLGMRVLVQRHPGNIHPPPTTLTDWGQHLRFAVLTFGAYFQAFYPPYDQVIGGGVDVVSVAWPQQ